MIRVASIQRGCVYDGPGIRTTAFLQGCALDCPWCCNPEMRACDAACMEYAPEELAAKLCKDRSLFRNSGGGVTFSGGEPLLQSSALVPALELLRSEGVSVWFETTLQLPVSALEDVMPFASGFIIDLKLQREMHPDEHYLSREKEASGLLADVPKIYRLVFVDSVWEDRDAVVEMLGRLGVTSLELLKCHNLAASKYAALGLAARDFTPSGGMMEAFSELLITNGIENKRLTI